MLAREGIAVIRLPPQLPNLNAYAERNHQGLGNALIVPKQPSTGCHGTVARRQRLGSEKNEAEPDQIPPWLLQRGRESG
jgi:hypothetical protein